jgi:hypothetical protein
MLIPEGEEFFIHHGDAIPHMESVMPESSVDFAMCSPAFPALFAYSDSESDIGNVESYGAESKVHLAFFYRRILRVLKPGRVFACHVMQIPGLKRVGGEGVHDFRGLNIRLGQRAGFIYDGEVMCSKNPQALRDGSRVLTPQGWSEIQSLAINDQVIGSSGQPTRVVGVWPQGTRRLFRVSTSDGSSVDCDGNHLWSVMTTAQIHGERRQIVLKTEEIKSRGLFQPSGSAKFFLPTIGGAVKFNAKQLPLDPYLLGVLLGDGCLSKRGVVEICTQRGIVENLSLPHNHSLRLNPGSERGNDASTWNITCPEWHRNDVLHAIRSLGLEGKHAWDKFVPPTYLFADEMSRRLLIAGLLDTDGKNKVKGGVAFHTTSERLADDFKFLVESLGGICTKIARAGSKYHHNGETRFGRVIYELTPRLRDGICPFRFKDKIAKWIPPQKGFRRAVVAIEEIGEFPCTCITVEAEDGLFATESCILTHNSEAIRTRSRRLQFVGLERDRSQSAPCLPDYIIKFRKPGENAVLIDSENQVSRNQWIDWAEACWSDIRWSRTLNTLEAKDEEDTRHICAFPLDICERCVRLWSNPGELVLDCFCGVGSTGYSAIQLERRFYGIELKESYFDAAIKNCKRAVSSKTEQGVLFA